MEHVEERQVTFVLSIYSLIVLKNFKMKYEQQYTLFVFISLNDELAFSDNSSEQVSMVCYDISKTDCRFIGIAHKISISSTL